MNIVDIILFLDNTHFLNIFQVYTMLQWLMINFIG